MQKVKILYALIGILAISVLLGLTVYSSLSYAGGINSYQKINPSDNPESASLSYKGYVCVYKNIWLGDHYEGQKVVSCAHNVLYNTGKNMTRDLLGYGGPITANVSTISLGNASTGSAAGTPVAGQTEAFTSYESCGLNNATGTYVGLNSYDGNWTITRTFTSSCDNRLINVTRLQNASGGIFAGNLFTLVTLQTNDQLTVNWSISIS